MVLYLAIWYAVGFSGACLAASALRNMNRRYDQPTALTRGGLFAIALAALLGPLTWIVAAIWWVCELADSNSGWWSKPVFRSREGR